MRQGSIITYLGGTGVTGVSVVDKVRAESARLVDQVSGAELLLPDTVSLLRFPVELAAVRLEVGDITAAGGFFVIVAQFGWNVYRDRRNWRGQKRD